jgi:hypothetical protein
MNEHVEFIAGKRALIIKTIPLDLGEEARVGHYVRIPVTSDDYEKLRYIIDESVDNMVVIDNRAIIAMENGSMTVSFLLRCGKAVCFNRVMDSDDFLQLGLIMNYGVYGEEVSRYE